MYMAWKDLDSMTTSGAPGTEANEISWTLGPMTPTMLKVML